MRGFNYFLVKLVCRKVVSSEKSLKVDFRDQYTCAIRDLDGTLS